MSHPFGDLLSQYLHRKHGLSQSRLAEGILQDPAVITRMCKGERLSGPQARARVLSIVDWLNRHGALDTVDEANALLTAAGMSGLREAQPLGQLVSHPEMTMASQAPAPSQLPGSHRSHDHLPGVPTPFVGRARDILAIDALLSNPRCRLLTLAGPGGVGKTRLAIETASRRRSLYAHGAHFVNLEPVVDAEGIPVAIAEGLGIALGGREAPVVQLQRYLANKSVLLIFDSHEHLTGASDILVAVLAAAPGVQALITSREVLNLREEWQIVVEGLSVPVSGASLDETAMLRFDGVRLFAECAGRIAPFDLTRDPASVARICSLTEGLPLAVEMAAAWTKTMTCAEIAVELERGLSILTARQRNAPARHTSVQVVFDQSWRLLTEGERAVFARLAVFRGGFRRQAAVEVAGATIEVLSALVDKSFLRRTPEGRYQIHDLLRQYGEAKLAASGEDIALALECHARYFERFLCDEAQPHIHEFMLSSMPVCRPELENIRAAWRWAVQCCDTRMIRAIAAPFYVVLRLRCSYQELAALLGAAANRLMAEPKSTQSAGALIEVLDMLGWADLRLGRLDEAEQTAHESLRLQAQYDLTPMYGLSRGALSRQSMVAAVRGNHGQAEALARQLIEMPNEATGTEHIAIAYDALANTLLAQGRLEEAEQAIGRAIDLCKRQRGRWITGCCFITLGNVKRARGDWRAAGPHYQTAYEIYSEFEDPYSMAFTLRKLGDVALDACAGGAARQRYAESHALYRDLNERGGIAATLMGLGDAERIDGQYRRAAEHYRESLGIARDMGNVSLIFALTVAAADLFFRTGHAEIAAQLAALASHHPSSDHFSSQRAQALLAQRGLDAPRPETVVDWDAAVEAACDIAARALDGGVSVLAQAAEWQPADGYISD